MKTERSEAERELGDILKGVIDQSPGELDLFAELKPAVIPSPEFFMTDRSNYQKSRIIPAIGIAVAACSTLVLVFFRIKNKNK